MGACYTASIAAVVLLVFSVRDGYVTGVVLAMAIIVVAALTLIVGERRGWFDVYWWKKYR